MFAAAVDAMFSDPVIARDALYRITWHGGSTPVRIILRTPDEITEFNGSRYVSDTMLIDVRVSDVPELAPGNIFELLDASGNSLGEWYEIQGEPRRDSERLIWKAEAVKS